MKKQVELSLETAKEMYDSGIESLKAFALDNYPELGKKPLPKTWEELEVVEGYAPYRLNSLNSEMYSLSAQREFSKALYYSREQAKAAIALAQLSQLKAAYNDGWEPCYNGKEEIYTILISNNVPIVGTTRNASRFLTFKSEELRDQFLKHFRDLIMQAKPLL